MAFKKAIAITAAVVCVLLLAGAAALSWESEERGVEDISRALELERQTRAAQAEAVLPILDRMEAAFAARDNLEFGSPEYNRRTEELQEVQNLIAAQIPELVAGRDAEGNAVIVEVEAAREILQDYIEQWEED